MNLSTQPGNMAFDISKLQLTRCDLDDTMDCARLETALRMFIFEIRFSPMFVNKHDLVITMFCRTLIAKRPWTLALNVIPEIRCQE
jgi:hypothetical protein